MAVIRRSGVRIIALLIGEYQGGLRLRSSAV